MVDEIEPAWTVESIPDVDRVFMRAHEMHFRDGKLQPGVFRQHGDGMSVDWEKYSTPPETKGRAKKPSENAVVGFIVGVVRAIPSLEVQHKPERSNRAHSNVMGLPSHDPDLVEIRLKLLRISTVVLELEIPR